MRRKASAVNACREDCGVGTRYKREGEGLGDDAAEQSGSELGLRIGVLGDVWRDRGTERQVLHRRRCRPDKAGIGGGLAVQF